MTALAGTVFVLLVLTTALWNILPRVTNGAACWALPLAGLTVLVALVAGLREQRRAWLPWLALAALAITTLFCFKSISGWTGSTVWADFSEKVWFCGTACDAGKFYETLFKQDLADSYSGIPTWAPACGAYLLLVLAAWGSWRRESNGHFTQLLLWSCLGASAYYLVLSAHLGMICPHCLAVHTIVLCFVAAGLRAETRWRYRLGIAVLTALALHVAYHPFGLVDKEPGEAPPGVAEQPPEVEGREEGVGNFMALKTAAVPAGDTDGLGHADLAFLCDVDQGRRIGRATAPYRVEFVVTLTCPHCEDSYDEMHAAWKELIEDGTVRLVFRHRFRWREENDRYLARIALAAAASGTYREALFAILGVPDQFKREDRLKRIEVRGLDPAPLVKLEAERRALFDRLLAADHHRLGRAKIRSTPWLRLVGPAWPTGRTVQGKKIDFPELAAAMAAQPR